MWQREEVQEVLRRDESLTAVGRIARRRRLGLPKRGESLRDESVVDPAKYLNSFGLLPRSCSTAVAQLDKAAVITSF